MAVKTGRRMQMSQIDMVIPLLAKLCADARGSLRPTDSARIQREQSFATVRPREQRIRVER